MDVPVPQMVILARGRDAAGIEWGQVGGRGASTGGWCARTTPSGTAQRDSPPAQGGTQILGNTDVVHVPVILQLVFQQSLPINSDMVPQIQFIVRVLDIPLVTQRSGFGGRRSCELQRHFQQFTCRQYLQYNSAENHRDSTVAQLGFWLWTSLCSCSDVQEVPQTRSSPWS